RYYGPRNGGWAWRIRCKETLDHQINAIALPGGRIYVYDCILTLTHVDDELAAVLAHEIIHVVEEHSAEQLAKSGDIQRATEKIVTRVSRGNGQSQKGKIAVLAGMLGSTLIQMHLSREDEYEADERGFQLLVKAGYDPYKALVLLQNIERIELSANGNQGILGSRAFSTHPPTTDRIANLQGKIPSFNRSTIDNVK
ncbi:MAG TPA: M48 family metallopeptidase, partial [Armatimonadota bacterium]|nr:M48 family metallopeptidase [Armatimonadota bacterium]